MDNNHRDSSGGPDAPVLVDRVDSTGVLELNRPRALNSLNLEMVRRIAGALERWRGDDSVAQVLICSATPKAFCAGGDVRAARDGVLSGRTEAVDAFFAEEYALNLTLARYPKPVVALVDGAVMGGGLGLAAHGARLVATDRAVAAMPESDIGFITDVGMSRRFSALRGGPAMGAFLALTGRRLNAAEMAWTGLATDTVGDTDAATVRAAVVAEGADAALARLAAPPAGDNGLAEIEAAVGRVFTAETWGGIEANLAAEPELAAVVGRLTATASPSSLVASTLLLAANHRADLADALERERRLAAVLRARPDFAEGVRAVLVDKDHRPRFFPATTAEVDPADFTAALTLG